jgi:prepilin-type N-terminal cleavage/methylation domain-containing protein
MEKGFTLIEVVIAIGAVSLLAAAAVSFTSTVSSVRAKSQAVREVGEQGRLALLFLEKAIEKAEVVILPAAGTSGQTLSLDVLEATDDPTIFNVSSGVLYITAGANPPIALTNSRVSVVSLDFTNLAPSGAPGSVKIELSLMYAAPDGSQFAYSETFYTTATLRAR